MHIAVNHGKILCACDLCGHLCTNQSQIRIHKKNKHTDIYDYVCHICSKQTKSKEFLRRHLARIHGEGELKFECDRCDRKFFDAYGLKTHAEAVHDKTTLYQCEECPKSFWLKNYLDTHIRLVHKKIRPHKCNMCEEAFPKRRDLVKHQTNNHH